MAVSVLSNEDSKLIKDICIKNVPFWNHVNYDDIEIKISPNSVSNFVFLVKLICPNNAIYPNRTVILKKRTSYSNVIYDRELQCDVAEILGENGLGPRVIGRFSDFTIQEYVEGTVMTTASYKNLSVITGLASSLAKFHKKGTEISPAEWDRTPLVFRQINKWSQHAERIIKKNNLDFDFNELQSSFEMYKTLLENHIKTSNSFSDYTIQEYVRGKVIETASYKNLSVITGLASSLAKFHKKGTEISPAEWDRTPLVYRQINKWSQHAERIIMKNNLDFDFNELQSSFEMYKTLLENHIKTSNSLANSVLFCHNDLFYKNILHFQHGIYFIDFDYAGFNYVGWDIANFFYRSCFVFNLPDYPYFACDKSLEPSDEFKSIFVSVYLSQLLNKNVSPSDNVVKEFLESVQIHRLGSQLTSTYWGIIM
ncbi:choline kinase [Theileria orientalis]|uniref:ethanolamine kinase n=1 Tax=Theileria orientalis TaxID=68886 RepID=A0A976QRK7_THEOR|nr:choline kinase [Theileria orientalis]